LVLLNLAFFDDGFQNDYIRANRRRKTNPKTRSGREGW